MKKVSKNLVMPMCTLAVLLSIILTLSSCYDKEKLDIPVHEDTEGPVTELDHYIQDNFIDEYGVSVRYKYVDRYVNPTQRVAPPRVEVVRPMLDFIEEYWINPYLEVENGEAFFRDHVPALVVFLGGPIFNGDGTITLGTADAGAQITFTDVNSLDLNDTTWRDLQLQVVYHEFSHIVHQKYKLPPAFETIAPRGYTSPGSWFVLTDEEALTRGFVSPYATSSPNEDFAETVAFYLFDQHFHTTYTIDETNCATVECESRNTGRGLIRQKLAAITDHYEKVTGINLTELRAAVQSRL